MSNIKKQNPISFGIVGCGLIAKVHATAIQSLSSARLCGVTDHSPKAAQDFAATYGAVCYDTYEQLLDDPKIDVICICTPSGFHTENAILALRRGKHVVLEKPMALSVEDAERIIRTCDETGRLLTVISQMRFSKDCQKAKQLVQEGAFGKLSLASLRMKYYRSPAYYSSWKGTKKLDGGGALMNQGIHGIDLLQHIVGPVRQASGRIKTLVHQIEVEDTAVATLEFESGVLGVVEGSTCAYPGFERVIEIHGDRGYLRLREDHIEEMMLDGEKITFEKATPNGTAHDPSKVPFEGHKQQLQNLIAAIRGEEKLLIDCREGKKAIEIIESIYRSSQND